MVGLYTPGLDDRDRVYDAIQKLLQEAPIQKQNPDGSTELQPSIEVDDFSDDPNLVVQLIQGWAQKASLSGGIRETNPNGFANVLAWGKGYKALLNPPPPPPPPIDPKVSISVNSKDLAPNQIEAVLGDVNLQIPEPEMPKILQGPQGPPMPPAPGPQGPPQSIQ